MRNEAGPGKEILVLAGSPRRNGNSALLAQAFARGARQSGHRVEIFEAAFHRVEGCRACEACWKNGAPCVFEDDFNRRFAPLVQRAQVLVLCSPLYFFGMPAPLKAVIDKLHAYTRPWCAQKPLIAESALLACGADGEEAFSALIGGYRKLADYMGWRCRGRLIAFGVHGAGEVANTEFVARAEALGAGM